ncbi:MAG: hypothetical protein AB7K86_01605 [Rhodospirillales bacterium]
MPSFDKPRLRQIWRRLAAVPAAASDADTQAEAAQERLDFVAMLAGLKPAYLLGRGYDDPTWREAVLNLARDLGLHVVIGPFWQAIGTEGTWPDWYAAHVRAETTGLSAWYICRARAVAAELQGLAATGRPTVAQEARLLGYPECCVRAHYERARIFHELWLAMLDRAAGGDVAAMQQILRAGTWIEPATDAERETMAAALDMAPAPFTSVNMCAACAADPDGPARRLSAKYRALLTSLDPLAAAAAEPPPRALPRR